MLTDYPGFSFGISETGDFFKVGMHHISTKASIKPKAGLPENLPENFPENLPAIQKQIIEKRRKEGQTLTIAN
ncbi:MAG: hypothetical protein U9R17_08355 [Thermodesulfobacteriota bacterium]|nr:hypothetical protein [Thermodesulfobacteriota bacterium]